MILPVARLLPGPAFALFILLLSASNGAADVSLSPAGSPTAPTPTSANSPAPAPSSTAPIGAAGTPDAETLDEVASVIRPDRLIRITRVDRLRAEGYAVRASELGVHGFVPREAIGTSHTEPELIPWSRIQSIDRRGNNARRGALYTGLTLGALGATIGAAAGSLAGGDPEVAGGATLGFAVAGTFGALLGAGIGATVPAWHRFY